jgi:hypothetical protein
MATNKSLFSQNYYGFLSVLKIKSIFFVIAISSDILQLFELGDGEVVCFL